ncbi:MAG: helix-turn-helix domain-containing protein [Clostridia bacterium]|nr:helix-turn-helix domain-containing protein [Clostridia bacterium]
MNDYKFGNFLFELREAKGLTQLELAKMLDVTPAAVSKWENGESKPRIETLFKLAKIFSVTVEELMAGEFIVRQNEEVVDKKYEYLRSLDSLLTGRVRISRICAYVFDWCLIGCLPVLFSVIMFIAFPFLGNTVPEASMPVIAVVMLLFMVIWLLCFSFRDFIFKGRSPGKRFFGLTVIDRNSGETPSKKQLLVRNLFFFVRTIDGIIMLVRGISIGDSVAQTFVVSKDQLENKEIFSDNVNNINHFVPAKKDKKRTLVFLIIYVLVFFVFTGIAFSMAFGLEKSEPYQAAYNYLIESESFKRLNINEERVKWISLSGVGIIVKGDTNEVTFQVEGRIFEVISHKENGKWVVCEDCTTFR